jgi:hypothetical protein
MSHFAKVNAMGVVEQVIVAEQDFIDTLPDATSWVQTSYNTHGGQHPEGRPFRKNYAGMGFRYDPIRDAFIPPQPYPSWSLNEDTCLWEPPVQIPQDDKLYEWDDTNQIWISVDDATNQW